MRPWPQPRTVPLCLIIAAIFFSVSHKHAVASPSAQKSKEKPYALIIGTVWGPNDRPVYGVKVKIRRAQDKKPKWEMYSDHNGEFAQRVPPGKADYVLWADLKNVKSPDGTPLRLAQEVTIHVEYDERVDTGLHLTY
jgi:hypothetical protein